MEVEDRLAEAIAEIAEEMAARSPRAACGAAPTVAGSKPETEVDVIGAQQWQAIHEQRAGGRSVSVIARDLGLDRKTVRSCLRRPSWKPYRREASVSRLLDAHRAWLTERAGQVNYSARILYQELCGQRGFAGCYETVKLAVRPLRAAAVVAALTQRRFETAPGEQAQCDWGQISVSLGGVRTKIHVFVMTLGYSRRGYAEGFEHERMASLLAAHENAFVKLTRFRGHLTVNHEGVRNACNQAAVSGGVSTSDHRAGRRREVACGARA